MDNFKIILGIIAVFLTLIAYFPYVKNTLIGKTKPHIYSWFLWSFDTGIIFALQINGKAGAGAFVTLAAGIMCITVFLLSFFRKGEKDITSSDTIFLIVALISLGLWLFAKQPVLSIILITLADLSAFLPTVRKSWKKPHSETMIFYIINTFLFVLTVFALQRYSIVTVLQPTTWIFGNGLFALMLFFRRKILASKSL